MADKIKVTAQEELQRVAAQTKDAAASGAYIYPLRGILYYVSHRSLWQPLMAKLVPTLSLGVGITAAMFVFTFVPQMAVMAFTEGPFAPISTTLLVLSESQTLFNVLSKNFLIDDALTDTFDGTLMTKNMTTLLESGRQVKPGSDPINKLGKMLKKPFTKYSPAAIIRYFMYLPLNFIPVVGTVIFIILQGRRYGPSAHARYFQLKGLSDKQRDEWLAKREAAYTSFGVPAVLLELVPVVGVFFAFTNQVGAALWAADLEAKGTTAPGLREAAKQAE